MTRNFPKVQITFLLDLAAALPNRDQNGRAKRVEYGGFVRQRISSQCYKAALRSASYLVRSSDDGDVVDDSLNSLFSDDGIGIAVRSRMILARRVLPALIERGMPVAVAEEWVKNARHLFAKAKSGEDNSEGDEGDDLAEEAVAEDAKTEVRSIKNEPGFTNQVIVLGEKEIEALANTIQILAEEGGVPAHLHFYVTGKPAGGKGEKEKGKAKVAKPQSFKGNTRGGQAVANLKALFSGRNAGIDGAFFGRFATADFVGNVDAAVHVAHLISVNEISAMPDYFSVQDSILTGEVPGGAHLGNSEIASSIFLSTLVVDTGQLAVNFGLEGDENQLNEMIADAIAWLVRAVHNVNPSAKLGSTAPYGNVFETVVEIGKRQPHSHIKAFDRPLRADDYRDSSMASVASARLLEHVQTNGKMFGKQKFTCSLSDMLKSDLEKPAFEALAEVARTAVLEQLGA